jgi:hypothetical protein
MFSNNYNNKVTDVFNLMFVISGFFQLAITVFTLTN